MMNEDRFFRVLERMEERQIEQGQRLVAVEIKLDEVKSECSMRDATIADHQKAITGMRTIVRVVAWLGGLGGLSGIVAAARGFFSSAQ